ncbi:MAG: alpha/beta fold hydrolase [Cryomorphaceae bacterium]
MKTGEPYSPPFLHRWSHSATILPNRLRPIHAAYDRSETLPTDDGDFFTIDWVDRNPSKVAVLLHGLEGNSYSTYILGMARAFAKRGWSVAAITHRSCDGIVNKVVGSYHSGFTDDLRTLLARCTSFKEVFVLGFSLGGNMALKHAGEVTLPNNLVGIGAVSVPLHLASAAHRLAHWSNAVYLSRFLRQLKKKAVQKAELFPTAHLNVSAIRSAKNFVQFDDAYTAPAHGFMDAMDYYERSSAVNFLHSIHVPTLIINAKNDSFLSSECYPYERVASNPAITMETPAYGGHVGFASSHRMQDEFWHERRVMEFIQTFDT